MLTGRTSLYGLPFRSITIIFSLASFVLVLLLPTPVSAVPRNVTIDDQGGDPDTGKIPVYRPDFAWANEKCVGCAVRPDVGRLYNATATAATLRREDNITSNTLDFSFTGTAVYIFFTLFENEGDGVAVQTECNFTIDGEHVGYFNHPGDPTQPYQGGRQYQVPVFGRDGLEQKPHLMTISMADVPYNIFLSFDYAIYTFDPEVLASPGGTSSSGGTSVLVPTSTVSGSPPSVTTPNHSSDAPAGVIAGAVIGGLAVLAGFIALIYLSYCRRNRHRLRALNTEPHAPRPLIDVPLADPKRERQEHSSQSSDTTYPLINQPKPASSGSSGSRLGSGPGSRGQGGTSVEHRIRVANQRMRSLRAEMASTSGRTASSTAGSSRTESSRVMAELAEEVSWLRQELQALREVQRQQMADAPQPQFNFEEPPPSYTNDYSHPV